MLTSLETRVLRELLARGANPPSSADSSYAPPPIAAGDVVQIHPRADRGFGGMLIWVCQVIPNELRGFLLRPHRGGCREAWVRFELADVERIGPICWPDPEFARRCDAKNGALPGCAWAR